MNTTAVDNTQASGIESRLPSWRSLLLFFFPLAVLSFSAAWLNLGSGSFGGVTILWPSNAVVAAVLLTHPKRHWPALVVVATVVDLSVNLSLGHWIGYAVYLSASNLIEVLLAAVPLYSMLAPKPDLTNRRQLVAFVLYGVILAPAVTSVFASAMHPDGSLWLPVFGDCRRWFTADALGMATVAPLYLAFGRGERFSGRSWGEIAGWFGLLLGTTAGVFWQTRFPLLFVVLPVLLFLGIRLGLAGSALGLLLVSVIGALFSTAGHGPVALSATSSLTVRDLLFQAFIAVSMVMLYAVEVQRSDGLRLQADLLTSDQRFRMLEQTSGDIIVLMDLDGKRHYVSPSAGAVLGWRPEDTAGTSFLELAHPEDAPALLKLSQQCRRDGLARTLEYRCRKADGSYLWLEINARVYRDQKTGKAAGFVSVARDISLRKREEEAGQRAFEEVEQMACSDALTGIANRREFDRVLEREWLRAVREHSTLSLLLIDLDRFKPYNDLCGHLAGDDCLRDVTVAIAKVVSRPADLLARYGGEEFVVVLPRTDGEGAGHMAELIRRTVEDCRMAHPGNPPHGVVTLSIGCAALTPTATLSPVDLVEAADSALYQAKSEGRNCIRLADAMAERERL